MFQEMTTLANIAISHQTMQCMSYIIESYGINISKTNPMNNGCRFCKSEVASLEFNYTVFYKTCSPLSNVLHKNE